jgi:hypothetical protein
MCKTVIVPREASLEFKRDPWVARTVADEIDLRRTYINVGMSLTLTVFT